MPFEWKIDREHEIVRVRGQGKGSYLACRAAMIALVADPDFTPALGVLVDLRELDYLPSKDDAHDVVDVLTRSDVLLYHRVALVVAKPEAVGVSHQIATLAQLRGAKVGVFRSSDEALAWLRARGEGRDEPRCG